MTSPVLTRAARALVLSLLAGGCGTAPTTTLDAATDAPPSAVADAPALPPRAAGTRAPPTAECDPADPTRCLLPWPSDVFTERADTATGLRVRVATARTLNRDDVATLSRADGFSRATPVLAGLPLEVDRATLGDGLDAALRVIVSEPGEALGEAVPMRMHRVVDTEGEPRHAARGISAPPAARVERTRRGAHRPRARHRGTRAHRQPSHPRGPRARRAPRRRRARPRGLPRALPTGPRRRAPRPRAGRTPLDLHHPQRRAAPGGAPDRARGHDPRGA
ncbi:MAG: hypothetical protein U0325_19055 [Polyangiales bacterium]